MSSARQKSRKRRTPKVRMPRAASSGPRTTPMKEPLVLKPISSESVPRAASSKESSGAPSPIDSPNTATHPIAAARSRRLSKAGV